MLFLESSPMLQTMATARIKGRCTVYCFDCRKRVATTKNEQSPNLAQSTVVSKESGSETIYLRSEYSIRYVLRYLDL